MNEQHIEFLQSIGAAKRRHTGRYLLDHLQATCILLQAWGCDPQVCVAGLFHSVYGSNAFKAQSLSIDARDRLRSLIGGAAEHLVYLFCVTGRPAALLEAFDTGTVQHRLNRSVITINRILVLQLLEIECANLIEQGSGRAFLASVLEKAQAKQILLKPSITGALSQYLAIACPTQTPPAQTCSLRMPRLIRQANGKVHEPLQFRFAQESDIDQIVWLARELHVDSRYASFNFQKDRVRRRLKEALKDPGSCCILALRNEEIIGFLLGEVDDFAFAKATVAICRFLYVAHKARGVLALRLLLQFRHWAKKMRAQEIRLDDTFGATIERSERLFVRLGLKKVGAIYSLWL